MNYQENDKINHKSQGEQDENKDGTTSRSGATSTDFIPGTSIYKRDERNSTELFAKGHRILSDDSKILELASEIENIEKQYSDGQLNESQEQAIVKLIDDISSTLGKEYILNATRELTLSEKQLFEIGCKAIKKCNPTQFNAQIQNTLKNINYYEKQPETEEQIASRLLLKYAQSIKIGTSNELPNEIQEILKKWNDKDMAKTISGKKLSDENKQIIKDDIETMLQNREVKDFLSTNLRKQRKR